MTHFTVPIMTYKYFIGGKKNDENRTYRGQKR